MPVSANNKMENFGTIAIARNMSPAAINPTGTLLETLLRQTFVQPRPFILANEANTKAMLLVEILESERISDAPAVGPPLSGVTTPVLTVAFSILTCASFLPFAVDPVDPKSKMALQPARVGWGSEVFIPRLDVRLPVKYLKKH